MVDAISIIFYRKHLHIPTMGITPSGLRQAIEPIYIAELDRKSFVQAMRSAIEAGHPRVEGIPYSEYKKQDPILRVTKARSWKALARDGLAYSILWRPDLKEIQIDLPDEADKKGRFEPLTTKNMKWRIVHFSIDTPLEELAEFILEDIQKRLGSSEGANRS